MIRLLHISNNFSQQKIYINLVKYLSKHDYSQVIYTAIRNAWEINGNRDDSLINVEYHYAHILSHSTLSRLFYFKKLRKIKLDLESRVKIDGIDLIHAHFLFSDGGVAYAIKKKIGVPYVVSVRSSDLVTFFKYMPHLRTFGNKIMANAEKIIFISHAYRSMFFEKYASIPLTETLKEKSIVIPNAIDNDWILNKPKKKRLGRSGILNLIYVGRVIKRKKVDVIIKCVKILNQNGIKTQLTVVGDGEYKTKMMKLANDSINFLGAIYDRQHLIELFKGMDIFVMPSVRETFGLVYIEALSQGLPIIYCKNEAVDGFFKECDVGCAVKPNSTDDLYEGIIRITSKYDQLSSNAVKIASDFSWDKVGAKYADSYLNIFKG